MDGAVCVDAGRQCCRGAGAVGMEAEHPCEINIVIHIKTDDIVIHIKTDDSSIGHKIKIHDINNKEHHKEVIDRNEDYITIDSPIEDYEEGTDLFIYGKEIPDVKNVNYEALFVNNMRATQELYKRLKALEKYFNIVY
jgi:hypothetical protein